MAKSFTAMPAMRRPVLAQLPPLKVACGLEDMCPKSGYFPQDRAELLLVVWGQQLYNVFPSLRGKYSLEPRLYMVIYYHRRHVATGQGPAEDKSRCVLPWP